MVWILWMIACFSKLDLVQGYLYENVAPIHFHSEMLAWLGDNEVGTCISPIKPLGAKPWVWTSSIMYSMSQWIRGG